MKSGEEISLMNESLDESKIRKLLYKYVIIGLTYVDNNDKVIETIQLHGRITRINQIDGVVITREDKAEEYKLPADLSAFEEAEPGEYKLTKTGEIIVDPDYLSSWTIQKPV
jgi:hypothetical protein